MFTFYIYTVIQIDYIHVYFFKNARLNFGIKIYLGFA